MHKFALLIALGMLLAACSDAGAQYVGKWQNIHNKNDVLDVSKNGSNFIVVTPVGSLVATLKDDILYVSGPMGQVGFSYIKESESLVGATGTYKKK